MAEQLAPLRFVVYARDGQVLDDFTEDQLMTYRTFPERTMNEAVLWGYVAWKRDQEMRPWVYEKP